MLTISIGTLEGDTEIAKLRLTFLGEERPNLRLGHRKAQPEHNHKKGGAV